MIPVNFIEEWREKAPWQTLEMVEQDLVISRVLICLYNHPHIRKALAFRGGTALNKLYINPAARYSEDIDLVQLISEPIGDTVKAIRSVLDDWLGAPKSKLTKRSAKLIYRFSSVGTVGSKLKIEINTTEHFHIRPLKLETHIIQSPWFQGKADILTYELEELMATKLCALYQRSKGRDLFDLWLVHQHNLIDVDKTIAIFNEFCQKTNANITRALFEENLQGKFKDSSFRNDMRALLSPTFQWDFDKTYYEVMKNFICHLRGNSWKSLEGH